MPFDQPMTDDQIREKAPSVFATHAAPSVSDRYAYIPTYPVLRQLRAMGLQCVHANEGRKKNPDGREYAMHVLRFNKPDAVQAFHDRTAPLGHLIPNVTLLNSHDRTSPLMLSGGVDRKVCMNGLYVSDVAFEARVRHAGRSVADQVGNGTHRILSSFTDIIGVAEYWHSIEMSDELACRFAATALEIRGSTLDVSPERVVENRHTHRWEDRKPTLWNLFNRAQENLMNGDVRGRTPRGRDRYMTQVKSLAKEVDLNRKLWAAAAALAEEVAPRGNAVAGASDPELAAG